MVVTPPETDGFDAKRLYQIHDHIEKRIRDQNLPCASTVVGRNGRTVWYENQGFSDYGKKKPLAPNSLYRLASMTKPITAVAAMIQMERGKFRLSDHVSRFIPSFHHMKIGTLDEKGKVSFRYAENEIRIIDLLTHTSGLGHDQISMTAFEPYWPKDGDTLSDIVPLFGKLPLDFEPGTKTGYSALLAFDTLAYLVELTSGMSFSEFLNKNIFTPLEMEDTTFLPSEEQRSRCVSMYAATENGLDEVDFHGRIFEGLPLGYFSGGAGLMGTLEDYYLFAQMFLNQGELHGARILAPNTVRLMRQTQLPADIAGLGRGVNWGIGMQVVTSQTGERMPLSEGSYGWSGAYGTHFWIDPSLNITAVYCSNLTTAGGAGAVTAREFENDVMQAVVRL